MNLLNDNHKYLRKEYNDKLDKPSKKRKLQGLFIATIYFNVYAKTPNKFEDYDKYIEQRNKFIFETFPILHSKFKSKDLSTRMLIKKLLETHDKSNILIAHSMLIADS